MRKKLILLSALLLTMTVTMSGCGTQNISENQTTYNESESNLQPDITEENYGYQNEQKDDSGFGVAVDEVVKTYNRILIENNPDASQGDINSCSLKDYSLESAQSGDGRDINIYTYYFEGSKNYMGVNLIENPDSHKVIYADLFCHNNFLKEEKGMRIFQELYYCLTASVDKSIGISKFNEIWEDMRQNSDFSTVYNGKKFFCMGEGEATYLGITLPQ